MANIVLDKEKLENGPLTVKKVLNDEFLEKNKLIHSCLPLDDNNIVVQQFIEAGKEMEKQYNEQMESFELYIKECGKLFDLTEYYEKAANIGSVSKRSTGFGVKKMSHKKAGF